MTAGPVIETERMILRPIAPEDFPAWVPFYASERARFIGGPKDEAGTWWKMCAFVGHWAMRGFGYWSLIGRADGAVLGRVGLEQAEGWPDAELGWALLEGAEGRGLAAEGARAVLEWSRRELPGLGVTSWIDPANVASIRLAERLGAVRDPGAFCAHPNDLVWRHRKGAP